MIDDWYSITSDKIKQDSPSKKIENMSNHLMKMEEKLTSILNEQRENQEQMEKKLSSIEERLNNEILTLKNDLLKKTIELERSNNALLRHKIAFPFRAHQHQTQKLLSETTSLFSFLKL